jgi:hypothetical protein
MKRRERKIEEQRATDDDEPIKRLIEWQEHRYDPGHYTGGNIDPFLKGSRPNKYGFVLIFGGVIILIFAVLLVTSHEPLRWYYSTLQVAFALLAIVAGTKLLKKPKAGNSRARRGRKH